MSWGQLARVQKQGTKVGGSSGYILRQLDAQSYDGVLVKALLEDKVHSEFGIELSDFVQYCESCVHDKDVELRFEDLRASITSLQKLDNKLFK